MSDQSSVPTVPATVNVPVASLLMGISIATGYRLANANALPLLQLPGRQRVIVSKIAALIGREITVDMIADAKARAATLTAHKSDMRGGAAS